MMKTQTQIIRCLTLSLSLMAMGWANPLSVAEPFPPSGPGKPHEPLNTANLSGPPSLDRNTDLSEGGYILTPEAEGYADLADSLGQALDQRGGSFQVIHGMEPVEREPANVIALGQMLNNPLIERLYWNLYADIDSVYPGKGGYIIETVPQPLPVLPDHNVLVLGGSNLEQTRAAVDDFTGQLRDGLDLNLPPTLEVHGNNVLTKQVIDAKAGHLHIEATSKKDHIQRAKHEKTLEAFSVMAHLFKLTGDRDYLDLALSVLDRRLASEKRAHDGKYRSNLSWLTQRQIYRGFTAWDAILPYLKISESRQMKYERYWLHLAQSAIPAIAGYKRGRLKQENILFDNHTNLPLLGLYFGARYFQQRHGLDGMQTYLDLAKAVFMTQARSYLPVEDSPYYVHTNMHGCLIYYLATNQLEYFKNGNAQKLLDYWLAHTNNQGLTTAVGSLGRVNHGMASRKRGLRALDWYLKDPGLKYVVDTLLDNSTPWGFTSPFYPEMKPAPPQRLKGVFLVPMPKLLYQYLSRRIPRKVWDMPIRAPRFPYDKTFMRLQFRSSFDPDADYMLMSGNGRLVHGDSDANAIVNYSAGGYKFIAGGAGYDRRSVMETALSVTRHGQTAPSYQGTAGLLNKVTFEDRAFTRTQLKNPEGVNWDRNILWHPDQYFLVVDSVKANQPGDFAFLETWRLFNRGKETFDHGHVVAKAPGKNRDIDRVPGPPATFHLRSANQKTGQLVPHVSNRGLPIYRLKQNRRMEMKPGDQLSFQNIFYIERPDPQDHVAQYVPQRISEKALMVHTRQTGARDQSTNQTTNLVLLDDASSEGYGLKGVFASVEPKRIFFVETTRLSLDQNTLLKSSVPISGQTRNKTLLVNADEAGQGQIRVQGQMHQFTFNKGSNQITLPQAPTFNPRVVEPAKPSGAKASARSKTTTKQSTPSSQTQGKPNRDKVAKWTARWSSTDSDLTAGKGHHLASGNIDGEGEPEILASVGNRLICRQADGQKRWTFEYKDRLGAVAVGDLNQDGMDQTVVGTQDGFLLMLDQHGKVIKRAELKQRRSGRKGMRVEPNRPTDIVIGDLTGDGNPEVVSCTAAFQVYAHDADLNEIYNYAFMVRGGTSVQIVQGLEDDGSNRILATDHYRNFRLLDWQSDNPLDEEARHRPQAPPLQALVPHVSVATARVKDRTLIFATTPDGIMEATRYDPDKHAFKPVWSFGKISEFGFIPGALAVVRQSEPPLVVAGGETNYVYGFGAAHGRVYWQTYLGAGVTSIVTGDQKIAQVFAATEAGDIYRMSVRGKIQAKASLPTAVVDLAVVNQDTLAAMDTKGNIAILGQ